MRDPVLDERPAVRDRLIEVGLRLLLYVIESLLLGAVTAFYAVLALLLLQPWPVSVSYWQAFSAAYGIVVLVTLIRFAFTIAATDD